MDKVISNISNRIVNYLITNDLINIDKKSVYLYSVTIAIHSIINIIMTLVIGLLFGKFLENLCFFIVYKILRKFSGGFHSNNFSSCLFISTILNIIIILAIIYFEINPQRTILLTIEFLSLFIVVLFSPIPNSKKQISQKEFIVYKLISIIICTIILCFVLFIDGKTLLIYPMGLAMGLNSILVITEKIRTSICRI